MSTPSAATWIAGPHKLMVDLCVGLRVLQGARRRFGLRDGTRRLIRYLGDPRAIPRGGGNRYLRLDRRTYAIPALPPIDGPAFVEHLLDDLEALHSDGLAPLSLAMLCVTARCPHRCAYCYNAVDHRRAEPLELEHLLAAQAALEQAGVHNIFLSGGEPTLRLDAVRALLRARRRAALWLVTTGHGLDQRVVTSLAAAGLAGVMISIDGLDEQAHDAVKGQPGAYAQACRALGLCRDAGLVVGVNAMLGPALLERAGLEGFLARMGQLGAHFVSLNSPHPVAGDDSLEAMPVQTLLAVERLAAATRRDPAWASRPLAYSPDAWEALRGCVGGQEFVYIGPLGDLMSCPFLRDSNGRVQDGPIGPLLRDIRGRRAGCQVCQSLAEARCEGRGPL
jgi:MoaA/NifB/PqqE/SkfB family radical SAM enzyme